MLATSSDRKSVLESNEELAEYISQVLSQQDYYPFGMVMPGRSYAADDYRYGFNGMEQVDEVAGEGNSYTTHHRQYDARIARWTSVDPLFSSFSWQSPYAAFDNNPIYYKDPAGAASEGPGGPEEPAPDGSPEGFRQFWDDGGALERIEVFYWHYDDDGNGSWMASDDYRNQIEYLGALAGSKSYYSMSHLDVGAFAPQFLIDARARLYPEEFHDTYAEGYSSGWANAWASYQPAPGNVVMKDYTFDVILFFSTGGVGNGIVYGLEWTFTRAMVGLRSRTFGSFAARGSATTWNGFQKMTAGQFATRAEAGAAWNAYKGANGIVTGSVRSQAQKSLFLRNAGSSGMYPKYMNQWLRNGKVPPGYHVDHIKPLSIGGRDIPSNMRLLDIDFHINIHHKYYRPWQ